MDADRYLRIEDVGMTFETKKGSFVAIEGIDLTVGYDGQFGADDTAHGAEAVLKIGL